MEKKKLFSGILLFGSLWGFAEIVIGDMLRKVDLPAGAILTGVFAFGLMLLSRKIFKIQGMQAGMGLVAGFLRLFNPISASHICSAIAIMAEGLVFEVVYKALAYEDDALSSPVMKVSTGVISSYTIYATGYVVSQVLTAVLSSAGFHMANLFPYIPKILGSGLLAAVIGGAMVPVVYLIKDFDHQTLKNGWYYPASLLISAVCWVSVFAL